MFKQTLKLVGLGNNKEQRMHCSEWKWRKWRTVAWSDIPRNSEFMMKYSAMWIKSQKRQLSSSPGIFLYVVHITSPLYFLFALANNFIRIKSYCNIFFTKKYKKLAFIPCKYKKKHILKVYTFILDWIPVADSFWYLAKLIQYCKV